MDVLLQPFIIDKVFEFLSVFDIDRCQYVCRIWHECALRRLKKCPPIDRCQSIFDCEFWSTNTQDQDAVRQKEEFFMENRMSILGASFRRKPHPCHVNYWYLRREPISDILPRFKVEETLQDFLTNGAKCVPIFSFLQYNEQLDEKIMRGISFNYPSIFIKQRTRNINYEPVWHEMIVKSRSLEITTEKKFPKLSKNGLDIFSYFEGFHINRYNSSAKIIVTDWSDWQSPRPQMNDQNVPIKSVLCLATSVVDYYERIGLIEKLFKKYETKPIFSAGVLKLLYDWNHDNNETNRAEIKLWDKHITSKIFYFSSENNKPRKSSIITLAFAGEGVKSAVHDILFMPDFEEKLEEFKRSLDFPTDDGRVIGFILERCNREWYESQYPLKVSFKIQALFPFIKTSTINIEFRSHLPETSRADITFHLIRI